MTPDPTTPTPLKGGSGTPKAPFGQSYRSIDPALSACPDSYAKLLSWGWDTIQEAYDVTPSGAVMADLERAKDAAKQASRENGDGRAVARIAGEEFIIHAKGATGFSYRLETAHVLILIKNGGSGWGVSVRYLASGLWLVGWEPLAEWAASWIRSAFRFADEQPLECKISRADWCFDFYTPCFSADFRPELFYHQICCHSSSKIQVVGTSNKAETLTIGSKSSLQVSAYNKAKEITDISGKDYFEEIWASGNDGVFPYDDKPKDIWRLEVRMGKMYLKGRNVRTPEQLREYRARLIAGALNQIRLTVPSADSHKDRWPMHPLWSEAFRHCAVDEILPSQRFVSGQRDALLGRQISQIAGSLRTAAILQDGDETEEGLSILIRRVFETMSADEEAAKKAEQAKYRYQFVSEEDGHAPH